MALQTANQFQLGTDFSRLGSGIQQGQKIANQFQAGQERKAALGQAQQATQLSGQALGGNAEALGGLAAIDPAKANQIQKYLSTLSEAERAEGLRENKALTRTSLNALSLPKNQVRAFLTQERERFKADGRNTDIIDGALAGDDNALFQSLTMQAREGQTIEDLASRQFPEAEKPALSQKAEGGMVFNPNTSTYSIDPVAKKRLDEIANKSKSKGGLDFKDKQGLNKDITAIIKGPITIRRSAEELEKLKGVGSAAAKLGAVFKFMKSLDPTSVVRESEQGQVYSASGAAAQLAGSINSLLGKGKLNEAGFQDLVTTAKAIADANILSVGGEVSSLLDSFGETLPADFKAGIQNRIPEPFEITIDDLVNKYGTK
jgi:hypothetical protein